MQNKSQTKTLIEQLKTQGSKIEYTFVGNIPKNRLTGEIGEKEVYQILVAAPATAYSPAPHSPDENNEIQFLCALHGFRAQFIQAIAMAKKNNKPVILNPTAVGLGVFGNKANCVASAYYLAAKEYSKQFQDNNVQVCLQVYKGVGDAKYMANLLGLAESQELL